jgi:hypothetical protein
VGLLLVAAVTVALAAPYGLPILGRGYADAIPLLQLLALAALPAALTEIHIGVLRAQNASGRIARVQAIRAGLVLGSVLAVTQLDWLIGWVPSTLTRVGIAVLVSQTVLAAAVIPRLRRVAYLPGRPVAHTGHPASLGAATLLAPVAGTADDLVSSDAVIDVPAPADGAALPSARSRLRRWALPGLAALCTATGVTVFVIPLQAVDLDEMNGFGLISVLPVVSLVGAALLALSFVGTLALRRAHSVILGVQVVLTVLCFHGLPSLLESLPRFPTAWAHMGFIEYITRTETTAPGIDARFSWPGFFALFAYLTDAREWQDLVWLVHLAPVVSNLLYLLPLALVLSNMRAQWRAKWLALWLFGVLNWVGQDYFSPQGLAYFLYLSVVAVLLTWFRPVGRPPPGVFGRLFRWVRIGRWFPQADLPGEVPARPISRREQVTLLVLVLLLFTFATASHQLTPFLMISACLGLVLVGRCVLRGLPALMAVIMLAWISVMAADYWSGHLQDLLGGIGELTANVSSSVEGRVAASNPEHLAVLRTRIALALGVGALAAFGAWRRRRKGFDDRIALVLTVSPIVAVALQSYGGEIALRTYLFALPGVCLLAAYAFFPNPNPNPNPGSTRRPLMGALAVAAFIPVLLGGFVTARYGNEPFERVRAGEVAALDYVYDRSPGPTTIAWISPDPISTPGIIMVNSYRDIERVVYEPIGGPQNAGGVDDLISQLRDLGPNTYLLTTRAQEAELVLVDGYPPGWGDRFRAWVSATPELRPVFSNGDAVLYVLAASPPGDVVEAQPEYDAFAITWTPLTATGLACLLALLGVLLVRELRRLIALPAGPRPLRPLTLAAIPLAFGLVVVVVERFVVLA